MMREFGTQMEKSNHYIDKRNDKVIVPKPVYTSAQWLKDRERNTLYIQCRVRGWFARRLSNKLREERDKRDQEL
jgi:hypothetical protein